MVFAWDEDKNRINRRKHGVSFETAVRIFEDPNVVSYQDRVVDEEERWHAIGRRRRYRDPARSSHKQGRLW
jgi:uncharacterized DUF497 family protein